MLHDGFFVVLAKITRVVYCVRVSVNADFSSLLLLMETTKMASRRCQIVSGGGGSGRRAGAVVCGEARKCAGGHEARRCRGEKKLPLSVESAHGREKGRRLKVEKVPPTGRVFSADATQVFSRWFYPSMHLERHVFFLPGAQPSPQVGRPRQQLHPPLERHPRSAVGRRIRRLKKCAHPDLSSCCRAALKSWHSSSIIHSAMALPCSPTLGC